MHTSQNIIESPTKDRLLLIQQRIDAEPAFGSILYKMLSFCATPRKVEEITKEVLSYPEMQVPLQTPQVLLSWLIQCQAVAMINESETSQKEEGKWQTTLAGFAILKREQQKDKIETLFFKEPEYKSIYLEMISFCEKPKSRMDIEKHFANNPLLENPKIYPSYFIDALESAGGLEWNHQWSSTQKAISKLI